MYLVLLCIENAGYLSKISKNDVFVVHGCFLPRLRHPPVIFSRAHGAGIDRIPDLRVFHAIWTYLARICSVDDAAM